ncbi:leucine-rich repeat domain-containing protein [Ammoniphilus sp. CFH 90114]|uniref:leucine-rich repeat domain-containing protein n=1 Tax=Ammoniphilus sp. CFH 90114 TaxID=2493665 RepID=UPI0013E97261|nr:leucine-rich repeat domain-containing protein [Ammoniphilus sp. CFH 90114]
MKKILFLILCFLLVPTLSFAEGGEGIQFADSNLEQAVREAIQKPSGIITPNDVAGLQSLDASNKKIKSLDGIQSLRQLLSLNLNGNEISDVSPLLELDRLQALFLADNKVRDLSFINTMSLKRVDLTGNGIVTIPELNSPTLTSLIIQNNKITSLDFVSGLPELTELNVSDNQIRDLTPLKKLTNLRLFLAGFNQIQDLTPIQDLPIRSFSLHHNQITSIEPIRHMKHLHEFEEIKLHDLSFNPIRDISPLETQTQIEKINLSGLPITDLSPLSKLVNLRKLELDRTGTITDISPLVHLQKLEYLNLGNNLIKNMNLLNELPQLKELIIWDEHYGRPFNIHMFEQFRNKLEEIQRGIIRDDMSELEKEFAIFQYIVKNTSYSLHHRTAYDALMNGVANCDGYATSVQILLDLQGIENEIAAGIAANGIAHGWNLVKIDGQYYHLDATYSDRNINFETSFSYFNVTDKQIQQDREYFKTRYHEDATSERFKDLHSITVGVMKGEWIYIDLGDEKIKYDGTQKQSVQGEMPIDILLNGYPQHYDQTPVMMNNRTLVPLRGLFEALGAVVEWDPTTNTAKATKDSDVISITIGSRQASHNGKDVILDQEAKMINGRTMVPLRFVSESLRATVNWNGESKTISIDTK